MSVIKYNVPLYKRDDVKPSVAGSAVIDEFVLDYPARGGVALKKIGEKKLYEMIQANLDNCDMVHVLESCVHTNQYAVTTPDTLNTMIADFTGVTNMGDLYAGTKRLENTWKDLPLEVRENFDGDIKKFIRGIGTDDFESKVRTGFTDYAKSVRKNLNPSVSPSIDVPDQHEPPAQSAPEHNLEMKVGE